MTMATLRTRLGWAYQVLRGRPVVTVDFDGAVITSNRPVNISGPGPMLIRGGVFSEPGTHIRYNTASSAPPPGIPQ